jgi:CheY-like chemotaxis protein
MKVSEARRYPAKTGALPLSSPVSPTIVLVDDDPVYGSAFQRAAEIKGVPCTYCETPIEFYHRLEFPFDIVLLDYDLGKVTGLQLSRVTQLIAPQKFVVMTSSYRAIRDVGAGEDFIKGFINKNSPILLQVAEIMKLWRFRNSARSRGGARGNGSKCR